MQISVLCTSVGNEGFQAIYRALKKYFDKINIIGTDANPYAYGLYLSDFGSAVPLRSETEKYIAHILTLCECHNIDLILPLSTEDQTFYALHRQVFEKKGIPVAVSPLQSVNIANNKHLFLKDAERRSFPVPRNTVVASKSELVRALDIFDIDHNPVVIKKEFSTGAQGVKIVKQTIPNIDRLFSRDNIIISREDLFRWLKGVNPFPPLQVSEWLDMRYSVDVFISKGKCKCAVVRKECARFYGMAIIGEVIDSPKIKTLGIDIVESLGLENTINVEIGIDSNGNAKLVEINPRFPASIDHTVMAGCNMPGWTVCAALGIPYEISQPVIGTRFIRHWTSFSPSDWKHS